MPAIDQNESTELATIDKTILPARSAGKNTPTHHCAVHRINDGVLVIAPAVAPTLAVNTMRSAVWPEDDTEKTRLPSDHGLETDEWLYGALLFSELHEGE